MKRKTVLIITLLLILSSCNKTGGDKSRDGNYITENPDYYIAYANYTGSYEIYLGCLNKEDMYVGSLQYLPVYMFDSLSAIDSFRDYFYDTLTFDKGYDNVMSFNEAVQKYDDDFYTDNSLILIYIPSSSGSYRYGVDHIYNDGDNYRIFITQLNNPEIITFDMSGWFIIVEESKDDIADIDEFDAVLN